MIVMNRDGELFDERRKGERRVCKRRNEDLINDKNDVKDRRKEDRRKEDINAVKIK